MMTQGPRCLAETGHAQTRGRAAWLNQLLLTPCVCEGGEGRGEAVYPCAHASEQVAPFFQNNWDGDH